MKSAGKARNNGLYRHIRTSKEIIRNLLNDYIKPLEYWQICDVIGIRFTRVVKTAFWIKRLRNTDYPTVIVLDFLKCSQIFSPRFHNLIFKGTILRQVGILPQTLVSDQLSKHPFFRFNHIVLYQ